MMDGGNSFEVLDCGGRRGSMLNSLPNMKVVEVVFRGAGCHESSEC